jgi:hypothetical protein
MIDMNNIDVEARRGLGFQTQSARLSVPRNNSDENKPTPETTAADRLHEWRQLVASSMTIDKKKSRSGRVISSPQN